MISPDGKKEEIRGVYRFREDELHLCLGPDDEPRPAGFRPSSDTGQISMVMKRERP